MGRQQWKLLVCSATAIALLASSLFVLAWFRIELMGSVIEIDLHSANLCSPLGACSEVSLSKLSGMYPATSTVAFLIGLALVVVVVIQSASKLVTGVAHDRVTRIGYVLGMIAIVSGFAAGYLFGPDGDGLGAQIANISVERTWAPFSFLLGSLASLGALYFAVREVTDDDVAAYKPVHIEKRLPVTPISGVNKVPRPPTNNDGRTKSPTPPPRASTNNDGRTKAPSSTPPFGGRSLTPGGGFVRSDMTPSGGFGRARSLTPGGGFGRPEVTPTGTTLPGRSITPSGSFARLEETTRPRPPTQPPIDTARTKTSSQPPLDAARTKTSSQPPLEAARTKTSSQPPDPLQRSRTSSSGPIDLAARLSASKPNPFDAGGLEVSIRPPLPSPEPVPADQIPVDPAAGLTIRKRTQSSAPLSESQLPPIPEVKIRKSTSVVEPLPQPPVPAPAFAPPIEPAPPAKSSDEDSMPRITVDGLESLTEAILATAAAGAAPAAEPVKELPSLPEHVRGKIKFAAITAELVGAGIKVRREDGLDKLVSWGEIVGVVARRLPAEKPFEGATFVDLVSTAGSTIRVVPWTKLEGHTFERSPVERARSFVNVVAAMALDAKLDGATKKFAEGTGDAAQLTSVAAMATHDTKVG